MGNWCQRQLRLTAGIAALLVLLPSSARAQDDQDGSPAIAKAQERRPVIPALTTDDLATFADLVGESPVAVAQRLRRDPGLASIAVAAADARAKRQHAGKVRSAVGFTIFASGVIATYLLWPMAFSRDGDGYRTSGELIELGYLVAGAAVVGFGIGISGIVTLLGQSETEVAAAKRYHRQEPLPPAPTTPAPSLRHALCVPLLALTF